jgi:hypothetical protein
MLAEMGLPFGAVIFTSVILPWATVSVAWTAPNGSETDVPVNVPETVAAGFTGLAFRDVVAVLDRLELRAPLTVRRRGATESVEPEDGGEPE